MNVNNVVIDTIHNLLESAIVETLERRQLEKNVNIFRTIFLVPFAASVSGSPVAFLLWLVHGAALGQDVGPLEQVDHERGVVSANEEALIKAQVLHVIDRYYELGASGRVELIPRETHMIPWIFLGRPTAYTSAEQTVAMYEERGASRKAQQPDYHRSTYTARSVCVLSRLAAITSGFNTRTNSEGGVLSVEGVSYILTWTPDGWRIAAFSPTTPGKTIQCWDSE